MTFEEKPPYEYILSCLKNCFYRTLSDRVPQFPIVATSLEKKAMRQKQQNFKLEWTRTIN